MKTAPRRRGRFYIKYLSLFACFCGSLLIGPAVLAQAKKATTTTVADNKYGEGGTLDSTSDEKHRLLDEVWKDKHGKVRETHTFSYGDNNDAEHLTREYWSFSKDGEGSARLLFKEGAGSPAMLFWKVPGTKEHRAEIAMADAHSLIEEIEKQFARDGTIPDIEQTIRKTASSEKKKEEEKGKVDTVVEQPGLDKQRQVYVGAEQAKADAQKRAEVKAQCDGIREKIRTLQDLLRKSQAEPATPKQELETIRKQIDELLSQLADCPKQEPIDAQFDCLKSKFPEVRRLATKPLLAVDPTSSREFAWDNDKQAWIDENTRESICPPSGIDSCLVGTWECTSFKEANKFINGGGTGFRVTFKSDGTETVDYSKMQPIKASDDINSYLGTASARISTKDGVAKIESIQNAGASLNFVSTALHMEWKPKIPGLGPGGLGSTKGKNNYKCTENSLEYQSSTPRGDADCTVKLTKVKPEGEKK